MKKQRILIVDDTPANIKILNDLLRDEYSVSIATSGSDALELVKLLQPDLILLDIMMPGMDGYEVCRRLKQDKENKDIPVIFVTAMNEVADETKGLELGAVDYITKPISPPIVRARVRNHLLLKKQHDQLKKSISIMEHNAEMLKHKAELGLQAGGLAHDINNILTVCSAVNLIPKLLPDDFSEKETVQKYVDMALSSVRLGAEICQGYTSYLKNIGADFILQPVLPLLQPIDMYSRVFKGEVIKDFAKDLPLLFCKGFQIKRVLVNLFINACQAVDGQKKQIISLKVWGADGGIYFSVQDNGQGIPGAVLPNIFKECYTTKENGTGLGLFMVKEIIENHHGTIKVDTTEGEGTNFTFFIPVTGKQNDHINSA